MITQYLTGIDRLECDGSAPPGSAVSELLELLAQKFERSGGIQAQAQNSPKRFCAKLAPDFARVFAISNCHRIHHNSLREEYPLSLCLALAGKL